MIQTERDYVKSLEYIIEVNLICYDAVPLSAVVTWEERYNEQFQMLHSDILVSFMAVIIKTSLFHDMMLCSQVEL